MNTIDEYILGFEEAKRSSLQQIREVIKAVACTAEEVIGYGIPTYKLKGNLVHFAGCKNHIGFYPGPEAIKLFADEITSFEKSKGSIHFPYDQPLPTDLITRIVAYRVAENSKRKNSSKYKTSAQ